MIKELRYNVWYENFNSKEIVPYNVFRNSRFYDGLVKATKIYKKTQDRETYREDIRKELMYAYWSKSEYEIVITSWPPYIDVEDIEKLDILVKQEEAEWGRKPYRVNIRPVVSKKLDIYEQVMLNFNIFIQYLIDHIDMKSFQNYL